MRCDQLWENTTSEEVMYKCHRRNICLTHRGLAKGIKAVVSIALAFSLYTKLNSLLTHMYGRKCIMVDLPVRIVFYHLWVLFWIQTLSQHVQAMKIVKYFQLNHVCIWILRRRQCGIDEI